MFLLLFLFRFCLFINGWWGQPDFFLKWIMHVFLRRQRRCNSNNRLSTSWKSCAQKRRFNWKRCATSWGVPQCFFWRSFFWYHTNESKRSVSMFFLSFSLWKSPTYNISNICIFWLNIHNSEFFWGILGLMIYVCTHVSPVVKWDNKANHPRFSLRVAGLLRQIIQERTFFSAEKIRQTECVTLGSSQRERFLFQRFWKIRAISLLLVSVNCIC